MLTVQNIQDIISKPQRFKPVMSSEDLDSSVKILVLSLINHKDIHFYETNVESVEHIPIAVTYESFKKAILNSKSRLLFKTSGTTGTPKSVTQTIEKLSKGLLINSTLEGLVWGFCYSTRHISGVLLMLQAILTKSSIVDLRNLSQDNLLQRLNDTKVTNISAPSTFYRLNFPLNGKAESVNKVTNGGEPLAPQTLNLIKRSLPKAEIRNVYASTEFGSILVSKSESFSIPKKMQDKVIIKDEQIHVHRELVSTEEPLDGDWYNTKDMIEWLDKNRFIIKGRVTEDVKVMGHLVSLRKIEDVLNSLETVKLSKVTTKPHPVFGMLLTGELVSVSEKELDLKAIKNTLKKRLRNYEIPTKIKQVDSIEMTTSGKIKR